MLTRRVFSPQCNRPDIEPPAGGQVQFRGIWMVVCIGVLSAGIVPAHGQTQSDPRNAVPGGQTCDGTSAPASATHIEAPNSLSTAAQRAQDPTSDTDSAADRLRLSVKSKAEADSAPAARPLCRREKPSPPCGPQSDVPCSLPKSPVPPSKHERPAHSAPVVIAQLAPAPALPKPEATTKPSAVIPVVQFSGGKLTIRASGEQFRSVLTMVCAATGATVDLPAGSGSDPVFMGMGPSSVREVLTALLDGDRYNYILIWSPADPEQLTHVIVSLQPAAAQTPPASAVVASAAAQPTPGDSDSGFANNDSQGIQVAPSSIPPSIPRGIDIKQLAASEGKTVGQVLDELQKQQLDELDAESPAPATAPPQ